MDTVDSEALLLLLLIAVAAALYSSVGHGGASGYLAVMALLGFAPAAMKPAALAMNIAVSSLVGYRLWRAGFLDWRLFWPFAAASVPLAFVGGAWRVSDPVYRYIVAGALLIAALRLFLHGAFGTPRARPPLVVALPVGGVLGFVSGLTGVGGGIFISPLLMLARWADARATAAISAAFIFVNSVAGLAGHALGTPVWPTQLPWMMLAALAGAVFGAELAVRRASPLLLRRLLGAVLVIAALKLVLT